MLRRIPFVEDGLFSQIVMPTDFCRLDDVDRRYRIRRVVEISMKAGKLIVTVIEMHTQQQQVCQGQYQITDAEEGLVSSEEHLSLNALVVNQRAIYPQNPCLTDPQEIKIR